MRIRLFVAVALLVASFPGRPSAATGCSECADLPNLYRELLEQEYLRNRFESWIKQQYYPRSVSELQRAARDQLTNAMRNGSLYGAVTPAAAAGGGGSGAAPAFGTDLSSRNCGLYEITFDDQGNEIHTPTTPQKIREKLCKAKADFVLAHEGHHQASCREAWRTGQSAKLGTVEWFVQNDRDAYQAGIAVLREYIAELASNCAWKGSTNKTKPDNTKTVPTPDQINELKTNKLSNLLKRSSR
jgi:hypothetical protein